MTQESGDTIRDLLDPSAASLSLKEVLQCVMLEWGGPAGLARGLKLDYDSNPAGSSNRIRITSDIVRGLQQVDSTDEDEAVDVEDLKALAKQIMEEEHAKESV